LELELEVELELELELESRCSASKLEGDLDLGVNRSICATHSSAELNMCGSAFAESANRIKVKVAKSVQRMRSKEWLANTDQGYRVASRVG